jgi:Zn-dependent peptidase ImmA (M78 family)
MSANLAHINPEIISWALKLRGVTPEQIATSQVKADQLRAWEEKRGLPTHAQADALANKLRIPLLVLFLSSPPDLKVTIPDLRTVSGEPVHNPSLEFFEVINGAQIRQDWYRDAELRSNASPLSYVGKFDIAADVSIVADDIRKTLSVDDQLRQQCDSWKQFLDRFIANAESLGILVFRSAIVGHATKRQLKVGEFRGFVLSDRIAPLIFINDDDAKAAQIFTIAHEVAHIWIGQTGVSDPNIKKRPAELTNAIERFCNRVAAEILVPEADFIARWNKNLPLAQNLYQLTAYYRVSSLVILIRAHDLAMIQDAEFSSKFDAEFDRFRQQDKKDKTAAETKAKRKGNFWASFVIRNSRRFTDMVVRSAREGRSRYTDAASLLGIKPPTLERYLKRLESPR